MATWLFLLMRNMRTRISLYLGVLVGILVVGVFVVVELVGWYTMPVHQQLNSLPESTKKLSESSPDLLNDIENTGFQTREPSRDDVQNENAPVWQTYTDNRYGFELKYPNNWSEVDNGLPWLGKERIFLMEDVPSAEFYSYVLGIAVFDATTIEDYISKYNNTYPESYQGIKSADNLPIGYSIFFQLVRGTDLGINQYDYLIQGDGFLVVFSFNEYSDKEPYYAILRTFRMLSQSKN